MLNILQTIVNVNEQFIINQWWGKCWLGVECVAHGVEYENHSVDKCGENVDYVDMVSIFEDLVL